MTEHDTEHPECPTCGSDKKEHRNCLRLSMRRNSHASHKCDYCTHPWHTSPSPVPTEMTTEQFRERVLQLIREWLQDPKVQADEIAVLALNALAGDIQVIEIRKDADEGKESYEVQQRS